MTNKLILLFIAMGAFTITTGFTKDPFPSDILKKMVTFDRYYIPALALTNQGEKEKSQKALKRLTKFWEEFTVHFYNYPNSGKKWQSSINQITRSLAKANQDMQQGKDLKVIHNDLESIRTIFWHIRKRNDVNYFPDYLTAFHDPMETLVSIVKGKKPDSLTKSDIRNISGLLPKIEQLWHSVMQAPVQEKLFNLNNHQVDKIRHDENEVNKNILNLKKALQKKDKSDIINSTVQIKPYFVKIYLMFGDFHDFK